MTTAPMPEPALKGNGSGHISRWLALVMVNISVKKPNPRTGLHFLSSSSLLALAAEPFQLIRLLVGKTTACSRSSHSSRGLKG